MIHVHVIPRAQDTSHIITLFYPYDMWSAELKDLTDDAVRLLIIQIQSTLSPILLAQGWVNFSG